MFSFTRLPMLFLLTMLPVAALASGPDSSCRSNLKNQNDVAGAKEFTRIICEINSPPMPRPTYMAIEIKDGEGAGRTKLFVHQTDALIGGWNFIIDAALANHIKTNQLQNLNGVSLNNSDLTLKFHNPGRDFEGVATIDAVFFDGETEFELAGCKVDMGPSQNFGPF